MNRVATECAMKRVATESLGHGRWGGLPRVGRDASGVGSVVGVVVAFELAQQRLAVDAEDLGGLGLVAVDG